MKYTVTDIINNPYQVFLIRCFFSHTTLRFSNKKKTSIRKTIAKINKPIRMLEITNDITLHSKTTHDIITCTSNSLYDKRRGQASKFSYIAYTLEGATSFILNLHCICRQAWVSNFHVKK